jgi:FixJ family two-component response regulator
VYQPTIRLGSGKLAEHNLGMRSMNAEYAHGSTSLTLPQHAPTVFVIDDDESTYRCLQSLIAGAGWQLRIFSSAFEFLAQPRVPAPSCLVLGVALLSGLDLQRRIAADRSDMPIILVSGNDSVPMAVQAMKAGAAEYFSKPCRSDLLLSAIHHAIDCSQAAMHRASQLRTLRQRYAALSPREKQVMALVVCGRLNKQTGLELGISEITVKAHRGRVMQKMNASSFVDLLRMARQLLPETDRITTP